jgi:hypothetical protein
MARPRAAALLCALTWASAFVLALGCAICKRTIAAIIHAHKQLFHELRCSSDDGPAFSTRAPDIEGTQSKAAVGLFCLLHFFPPTLKTPHKP